MQKRFWVSYVLAGSYRSCCDCVFLVVVFVVWCSLFGFPLTIKLDALNLKELHLCIIPNRRFHIS